LFAQQPVGQLVASHTHAPPTHFWPVPQAAAPPHLQVPPLQLSARFASHALHTAPAAPQAAAVGVTQRPALQQPLAKLVASHPHAPPTQRWPA